MKTEKYEGHSAALKKDTPWLASEDLIGHSEIEVVITGCYHHLGAEFEGGRKEDVWSLSFEGKQKQLVLNSVNRRAMVAKYGTSVKQWTGKKVTLYVEQLKRPFNGRTHGIRIKT